MAKAVSIKEYTLIYEGEKSLGSGTKPRNFDFLDHSADLYAIEGP